MKRYCKHVDITNKEFIKPFIMDCISRHYKRHDFKKFLIKIGMNKSDYENELIKKHNKKCLIDIIDNIAVIVSTMLKNEDLSALQHVKIREKFDTTCNKMREIGCEGPLQQILDFIAVGATKEIFDKRIVPQQCASIRNRGQIYGINMIKRWINKDNRALKFAKKHNYRYSSKCKYFVKLDIQKCYSSMRLEYFMNFFRKDCANKKLCWLWESLLKNTQNRQ